MYQKFFVFPFFLLPCISLSQILPPAGARWDIICLQRHQLPDGPYGDKSEPWSAENFTSVWDLCAYNGNPYGNMQGRCERDNVFGAHVFLPDEASPPSLSDNFLREQVCRWSCMCRDEFDAFFEFAAGITWYNIFDLMGEWLGDGDLVPRALFWTALDMQQRSDRRRQRQRRPNGRETPKSARSLWLDLYVPCLAVFKLPAFCKKMTYATLQPMPPVQLHDPPISITADPISSGVCHSSSCDNYRCGTGCSCKAEQTGPRLFNTLGCFASLKREVFPCPCNSTYVSNSCCEAGSDGMVWEPHGHKLGVVSQ